MIELNPPVDRARFFPWLKETSEEFWDSLKLNRGIYGFQIQPDTRWRPGLDDTEISRFESDMGFAFPEIYRDFLRCMNGTDKPAINLFGDSGEPFTYSPGFYGYPMDLEVIKDYIQWIYNSFELTSENPKV